MSTGPIGLVYYTLSAVPGAAAGLLVALFSGQGPGQKLLITIAGALGGIGAGAAAATLPTGRVDATLVIVGHMLLTGFCGWLLAFVTARLLRRISANP